MLDAGMQMHIGIPRGGTENDPALPGTWHSTDSRGPTGDLSEIRLNGAALSTGHAPCGSVAQGTPVRVVHFRRRSGGAKRSSGVRPIAGDWATRFQMSFWKCL